MTSRVLKFMLGALMVFAGILLAGSVNTRGACSNPFGYCINVPLIADYPALWRLPGGAIAALGGTLIGRALSRECTRPLQST